MQPHTERVPYRTILATIALVLATVILVRLIMDTRQVLTWMVIAAFFAVALYPVVNYVESRVSWLRRSMATLLVFLVGTIVLIGLIAVFIVPLAREAVQLAGQVPQLVQDARSGRGPVGSLLERYHGVEYLRQHQDTLQGYVAGLGSGILGFIQGTVTTVAAALTIFVLAYLMVLEGPRIVRSTLSLFTPPRAERIHRVGTECARAITGYISGNLAISVIAGVATYVVLLVLGVPYAGLLALFVGIADLIPLVGATLGAIVVTAAAFTQGLRAGIIVLVFFIVYQQVENHLLQPVIMSRAVDLDPLSVLIAVLIAANLAGILGGLLAIPIANMIKIILRDIWRHRRGRPLDAPAAEAEPVTAGEA